MDVPGKILTPVLKLTGLVKTPRKPPSPLSSPTRDDARIDAMDRDELRKRRGGAADLIAGAGGGGEASASAVGKATLGS
ncbi:hypothetical protein ACSMXM_01290 [Pacificimonas sp. ICDLI1SI03]